MKKFLILIPLMLVLFNRAILADVNLAATATITVSSTNGTNVAGNAIDNIVSTMWQSAAGGAQWIKFQLTKSVSIVRIELTGLNAFGTSQLKLSSDGNTWYSPNIAICNNCSGVYNNIFFLDNSFSQFSYVKINFDGGPNPVNLYEIAIFEKIYTSISSSSCTTGNDPLKALDNNTSTYFTLCDQSKFYTLNIKTGVKAIEASIITDKTGLQMDLTGNGGNVTCYYKTLKTSDDFYIVDPSGINSITFSKGNNVNLYEITLNEIALNSGTIPFTYDAAGNMQSRTIIFSDTKSAHTLMKDTIMPFGTKYEKEIPYKDKFGATNVLVYPNPTKGNLILEFQNLKAEDKAKVQLFSVNGSKIFDKPVSENLSNIDLLGQPNGTYILNITINADVHTWKIIKQ